MDVRCSVVIHVRMLNVKRGGQQFLEETSPLQRNHEQHRTVKADERDSLLDQLLQIYKGPNEEQPYFDYFGEDTMPLIRDAVHPYPVYNTRSRSSRIRPKRSFCDRYGNCGKRSGGKAFNDMDHDKESINHIDIDRMVNDNVEGTDDTDGSELTELYTNEVLPKLNTILGRKHITKKSSAPIRIVKRSVDQPIDKNAEEAGTAEEKFNERIYDKIKQYCKTHDCKIKLTRDAPKAIETDLGISSRQKDHLKNMAMLKTLLKESKLAANDDDSNDGSETNAKRANPFCPPWGCGRRRRKATDRTDGLKHELRDLLETSFLGLRQYRKIRPKSINTRGPYDRMQRLSLFCPYGGCRARP